MGAVSEQSQVTQSFSFFEVGDIFFYVGATNLWSARVAKALTATVCMTLFWFRPSSCNHCFWWLQQVSCHVHSSFFLKSLLPYSLELNVGFISSTIWDLLCSLFIFPYLFLKFICFFSFLGSSQCEWLSHMAWLELEHKADQRLVIVRHSKLWPMWHRKLLLMWHGKPWPPTPIAKTPWWLIIQPL